MKKIGAATALEVRATGIPYTFAPCIEVNNTIILTLGSYFIQLTINLEDTQLLFVLPVQLNDNGFLLVQVCRDPRWGRCYESYSEDPSIVRAMTQIIPGLQGDPPKSQKGVPYVAGQ